MKPPLMSRPGKWGYGATKMDDIPAHSTLIFELQLVKIER